MDERNFLLQERFEVRPTANAVVDTMLQKETKVEPRLRKLLCILAKQPGQLVKREQFVNEIWNDYGGGEVALNDAIFSLRKLLCDSSKELIEAIPTKGYILHADIRELTPVINTPVAQPKTLCNRSVLFASLILLASVILYLLVQGHGETESQAGALPDKTVDVPFDRVNKKTEETWLNTIVTTGDDGTNYK